MIYSGTLDVKSLKELDIKRPAEFKDHLEGVAPGATFKLSKLGGVKSYRVFTTSQTEVAMIKLAYGVDMMSNQERNKLLVGDVVCNL